MIEPVEISKAVLGKDLLEKINEIIKVVNDMEIMIKEGKNQNDNPNR